MREVPSVPLRGQLAACAGAIPRSEIKSAAPGARVSLRTISSRRIFGIALATTFWLLPGN
jgi:hypothetical protein